MPSDLLREEMQEKLQEMLKKMSKKRETDCRRRQVRFSFCLQKNMSDIMCHDEMLKCN